MKVTDLKKQFNGMEKTNQEILKFILGTIPLNPGRFP